MELEANAINLPKTIGAWTRPDSAQIIDSTNIFKYMNGAGELYLSYGFNHLEVYEYTADKQTLESIEWIEKRLQQSQLTLRNKAGDE